MSVISDLRTICTDPFLSVLVVAGGTTTRGMLDDQEGVVLSPGGALEPGEAMLARERVLTLVAEDMTALARKDTIQVGAIGDDEALTSYRVRDIRVQTDGAALQVVVVPA